jgi:hypothetical protein
MLEENCWKVGKILELFFCCFLEKTEGLFKTEMMILKIYFSTFFEDTGQDKVNPQGCSIGSHLGARVCHKKRFIINEKIN